MFVCQESAKKNQLEGPPHLRCGYLFQGAAHSLLTVVQRRHYISTVQPCIYIMSTQSHQSQARGSLALCSPGGLRSLSGEESPADPRGARWPLPPTGQCVWPVHFPSSSPLSRLWHATLPWIRQQLGGKQYPASHSPPKSLSASGHRQS